MSDAKLIFEALMKAAVKPDRKILLAEDEDMVRKSIQMLLEHDGFKVSATANAEDALELFTKEPFAIVITDFSMPGMNGGELAKRIKKLRPIQPVILATASIYKIQDAEDPTPYVNFILNKPFSLQELREALASVLPA